MEQEFDLTLTNQRKSGWLTLGFTAVILIVFFVSVIALRQYSEVVRLGVIFTAIAGAIYALVRLIKTVSLEPTLITISADKMVVLNKKTADIKQVLFDAIVSYRYRVYDGGKELLLTLKESTISLSDNSPCFAEMVQAFETAIQRHQQPEIAASGLVAAASSQQPHAPAPQTPAAKAKHLTRRERTFFEKPISTVVLVVMCLLVAATVVYGVSTRKPLKGGLFMGIAGFSSYVAAWYANRERRNAPS